MGATFAVEGIHAAWDPAARIFECRFASDAAPQTSRASEITAWTRETSGGGAYGILMDGSHSQRLSTAFRAAATRHLLAERDNVRVACYGLDAPMHSIVVLITRITRANVASFTTRDEAHRWLTAQPPVTPLAAHHRAG